MAKYGAFRYGTATKYGTGAAGPQPTFTGALAWVCAVEWTGTYSGASERVIDYSMERGAGSYIAASGGGFEPQRTGRCTVTLDNSDGRYDPYNSGSILYPHVAPGVKMWMEAIDLATGTHYRRFTGTVEGISIDSIAKTITLDCSDNVQLLERDDASPATEFRTNTSNALNSTLDDIGWHFPRHIQVSDNPLTLFSVDQANALYTVDSLSQGSLGYWFVDRYGAFVYYNRSYTSMPSHSVGQAVISKDISIKAPWETTRRNIQVMANRWARTPLKTVWSTSSFSVPAHSSVRIEVEFPNPTEVVPPVDGVDYSNSPGYNGVTITGDGPTDFYFNPLIKFFTVSISNITARSATLTVTNIMGDAHGMYQMRLRGREYINSWTAPQVRSSAYAWAKPTGNQTISTKKKFTGTSTALTGKFILDNEFLQDTNFADAYKTAITSEIGTPDRAPVLKFDTRFAEAFPIELGDKITVTAATIGLSGDFYALKIGERWTANTGQGYETIIYTGRRIFCTASITPEAIPDGGDIPDLPIDPPILPPPGPGIPIETYNDSCMIDWSTEGQWNNYPLTFDKVTILPGETAYAMFPCGIRVPQIGYPYGHSNFDWGGSGATTNLDGLAVVSSIDTNKNPIENGSTNGNTEEFHVGGYACAGFSISLPLVPPTYVLGSTWYTDEGLGASCFYHPSCTPTWIGHDDTHYFSMGLSNRILGFNFGVPIAGSGPVYMGYRIRADVANPGNVLYSTNWYSTDGVNWINIPGGQGFDQNWVTRYTPDIRGYQYVGFSEYTNYPVYMDVAYAFVTNFKAVTGYVELFGTTIHNVCIIKA